MGKKKIVVLGAGLIGSIIASDLSSDPYFNVTVVDISDKSLNRKYFNKDIKKIKGNILDNIFLSSVLNNQDLVVSAVPGFMGYDVLRKIIDIGKPVVDISFSPEDVMELDDLAKNKNISVFFDCGVAPGMSNMLVARGYSLLDETHSASIYVGGLPLIREWPYEYKAGFSPIDVIEEYTRPVFSIENGEIIRKEPLSELELINFKKIGTLEAFNTDGLRSLIKTLRIPNIKEKTLRYPGHVEKIKILKKSGFFDNNEINLGKVKIKPLDLTTKLLFPMWELKESEADFTVMKVVVTGSKSGKLSKYECNLYDEYDYEKNIHSMARTTGYTATTVLKLFSHGKLKNMIGVVPPEKIGMDNYLMETIMSNLKEKGVIYKENYFL